MKFVAAMVAIMAFLSPCDGGEDSRPPQATLLEMRLHSLRTRLNRAILKHPEDYSVEERECAAMENEETERDHRAARTWTRPAPEFTLPRLPQAPVIDGRADEAVWKQAREWRGSIPCSSEVLQADGAVWRLGWHDGNLYGHVRFPDHDMTFYRGRQGDPVTRNRIYRGDCLEVFIQPDENVPYYAEYLFRPDDTPWMLDHVLPESGFWTTICFHFQAAARVSGRLTADGYELEFEIGLSSLHPRWRARTPRIGDVFRMTMVRVNLDAKERKEAVHSSFYPLLYSGHNIFGYARVVLSDAEIGKNP